MFRSLSSFDGSKTCQKCFIFLTIIYISSLLFGCSSMNSFKYYEDPKLGILITYPKAWNLKTYDRLDNVISLQRNTGLFNRRYTQIDILVGLTNKSDFDIIERLYARINSLEKLNTLENISIVGSPKIINDLDKTIASVKVRIQKNSNKNQSGDLIWNEDQIVKLYVIKN